MRRMLIVEDEELVGLFLREEFSDIGFVVDVCGEAQRAFELCHEHEYEAAILDVALPDARGDELARRCRLLRPRLPIVLATGLPLREIPTQFTSDPLIGVLEKPYEMTILIDRLQEMGVAIE